MNTSTTPFFQKRSRIWLIVIILVIASLIAIIWPLILLHEQRDAAAGAGTAPQSFTVGTGALLNVKEQSGNVSIFPANTDVITVTPRNHGTLVAPDAHAVRILYDHTTTARGNDQLTVSTDPWTSNTDFYITIPASASTQITLASGSIDVHAGHGLSATTGSGSITFDNLTGPINLHTDSGDVTGNTVKGPLTIAASSGSIRLQGITGQLQAKTWSGDVTVHASALSGTSLLQTVNGTVRFDGSLDSRGSYTMQTTNGDVDLSLPASSAFALQASTSSGSVENDFGETTVGSIPQAPLSLHTQHGSVVVVKEG